MVAELARQLSDASHGALSLPMLVPGAEPSFWFLRLRFHSERIACTKEEFCARAFILAAGGIENPRILLRAHELEQIDLGPAHAVLGRYFMEHFHVYAGSVRFPDSAPWQQFLHPTYDPALGHTSLRILGFSDAAQRDARLLKTRVQITLPPDGTTHEPIRDGPIECGLLLRAEQAPNPHSRVLSSDDVDRFGRRRAQLEWATTEQDWDSIIRSVSLASAELSARHDAEVTIQIDRDRAWPWEPVGPAASARLTWGNHHMGTTRMNHDPARGVVDADCRVRETENLFVTGSSLFPTGGFANPTFTIVALAIRLADHVIRACGPSPGSRLVAALPEAPPA